MTRVIITFICVSTVFFLCSCSGSQNTSLKSTSWQLDSLTETGLLTVNKKPGADFSAEGVVSGFGGCNKYSGGYKSSAGKLTISNIRSTEMACDNLKIEQVFLSALMQSDSYKISGSKLRLYTKGRVVAVLSSLD